MWITTDMKKLNKKPYTVWLEIDAVKDSTVKKKKAIVQEKPVFRFFLSNGREVKSIEGLVVPVTERTETAYRLLAMTE